MLVDVVLNPAEIARLEHRDLSATTCVVFDVLRATSSMITALHGGVEEIYPVRTLDEAALMAREVPRALLGGERNGERPKGFHFGNSPLEYRELPKRRIVWTTTNGTAALRACEGAECVLVGAILNLRALIEELTWREPRDLLLVCAGTFEELALEDVWAAGALINELRGADLTDAAHVARSVAKGFPNPLDALNQCRNGRTLIAKGRREEVIWCARISELTMVGVMESAVIRPL